MQAWGRAVGRWRMPRKGEAQDAQSSKQRALPHTGKPLLRREAPSPSPCPQLRKHPRHRDTGLREHSTPPPPRGETRCRSRGISGKQADGGLRVLDAPSSGKFVRPLPALRPLPGARSRSPLTPRTPGPPGQALTAAEAAGFPGDTEEAAGKEAEPLRAAGKRGPGPVSPTLTCARSGATLPPPLPLPLPPPLLRARPGPALRPRRRRRLCAPRPPELPPPPLHCAPPAAPSSRSLLPRSPLPPPPELDSDSAPLAHRATHSGGP